MAAPFQEGLVIVNLISSIEAGKMRPVVARTCPLFDIVEAFWQGRVPEISYLFRR